jgi:hypothetical protein
VPDDVIENDFQQANQMMKPQQFACASMEKLLAISFLND